MVCIVKKVFVYFLSAPECGSNPGWRKNNGICYYYNDTDIVDFHMALVRCYEEKAQLVSIADEAEQSYVVSLVRLQFVLLLQAFECLINNAFVCFSVKH